jgi:hypothetical protein
MKSISSLQKECHGQMAGLGVGKVDAVYTESVYIQSGVRSELNEKKSKDDWIQAWLSSNVT